MSALRHTAEKQLPDPFSRWIDRRQPIPANVELLARTIDLRFDLGMFIILGTMFGGMGGAFIALPLSMVDLQQQSLLPLLIPIIAGAAMLTVPVLLFGRAHRTLSAWNDLRHDRLRQGVFTGPEGMLVRLEAGRCYLVPWDRFTGAKHFPPPESRDTRKQTMIVETKDGKIEFFAARLQGTPADLHRAAKRAAPSWSPCKSVVRRDRTKKLEPHSRRRFLGAVILFGGGMLTIGASLTATIANPGSAVAGSVLLIGFVLLGAGIISVVRTMVAIKFRYRCHNCGRRIVRLYEALPAVNYYCASCNIEWQTGLEEHESDGN